MTLLAEVSPDKQLSLKVERVPDWFEAHILDKHIQRAEIMLIDQFVVVQATRR
jgi:hypothetical protein